MKLNKTEQVLLRLLEERVRRGSNWAAIEMITGRGPEGGRIQENVRKWNAAWSLINKGLVRKIRSEQINGATRLDPGVFNSIVVIGPLTQP